jgi:hypothetical protein
LHVSSYEALNRLKLWFGGARGSKRALAFSCQFLQQAGWLAYVRLRGSKSHQKMAKKGLKRLRTAKRIRESKGENAKKIGSFSLIERVILSAGAMLIFSVSFQIDHYDVVNNR